MNPGKTHLLSHMPHITASSATHMSVAGAVVHTSQTLFIVGDCVA